jgi:hypothetical protein
MENIVKLLEVARHYNVPIATCATAYMNQREMPYWKISAVRETFLHDHPSARIDPRVHDPAYDLTVIPQRWRALPLISWRLRCACIGAIRRRQMKRKVP